VRARVLLTALLVVAFSATSAPAALASPDVGTVLDITFPVAGDDHRYIDDYSDSRGGGRLHQSTDIMAPHGTPVHAAMGGTISWITGLNGNPPSYGYMIKIRGDDGFGHEYVHLGKQSGSPSEAYASGMAEGARVERGQHIGYVGSSGCGCDPHLHYGVEDSRYPAQGSGYKHFRYNPYNSLQAAQERGDVPGGTKSSATSELQPNVPLVGDWNGDGEVQPGWWRGGQWSLDDGAGGLIEFSYGRPQDAPVVGNWDGEPGDEIGIIRDREWHLRFALAGGKADKVFTYGRMTRGDKPLVGDWNGDGRDEIGIVRDGAWHLRDSLSGGPADTLFVYGRVTQGDVPVIGDWDGNGSDEVGIVREGAWHLRNSLSGGPADTTFVYGSVAPSDVPVVGDWDNVDGVGVGVVRGTSWLLRDPLSKGAATGRWEFSG
jgi:hypothetical protein